MLKIETIFLFIFIFSIIVLTRLIFKFFVGMLETNPKPLMLTPTELLLNGFLISYILTYLIQN